MKVQNFNPKSWDEYQIKAKYLPTLASIIPVSHFLIMLLGASFWNTLIENSSWLFIAANLGAPLVMVLFLIEFQTGISKHWIEEGVFGVGGKNFPTTNMMLLGEGAISSERKFELRNLIEAKFKHTFSSSEDENSRPENARMRAREAIASVRRFVGKGERTHQYNIRYGFFRNLIGGVIWSVIGSLGCAIVYFSTGQWAAMTVFLALAILHVLLFLLKHQILSRLAFTYADTLFSEFYSMASSTQSRRPSKKEGV